MAAETIASRRAPAARFPGLAVVGVVARRAGRGGLLWGGVFGLMVWSLATQFAKEYPTAADRARLVATMGADVGSQAIFGPAHHLDTLAGYTAYHVIAVGGIIGAVWGLGAGVLAMWAVTAAVTVAVGRGTDAGFSTSASVFLAVAAVAATGVFLAVGAVCSQLAATRPLAARRCGGSAGPARWAGSTSCGPSPAAARWRCCRLWRASQRWSRWRSCWPAGVTWGPASCPPATPRPPGPAC